MYISKDKLQHLCELFEWHVPMGIQLKCDWGIWSNFKSERMRETERYLVAFLFGRFAHAGETNAHCYSLTENCRSSKRISAAERKLSIAMPPSSVLS